MAWLLIIFHQHYWSFVVGDAHYTKDIVLNPTFSDIDTELGRIELHISRFDAIHRLCPECCVLGWRFCWTRRSASCYHWYVPLSFKYVGSHNFTYVFFRIYSTGCVWHYFYCNNYNCCDTSSGLPVRWIHVICFHWYSMYLYFSGKVVILLITTKLCSRSHWLLTTHPIRLPN